MRPEARVLRRGGVVVAVCAAAMAAMAAMAACDPFGGVIKCDDDSGCPESAPFCVDGACAVDDDGGRDVCTADGDCGGGLCNAANGKCVGVSDAPVNCGTALVEPTTDREDQGPALFDVSIAANAPNTGGCEASFDVTFSYLDREGDMPRESDFTTAIFVRTEASQPGSSGALVGSQFSDDDDVTHRATVIYQDCLDPLGADDVMVRVEDAAGHRSNVVCAAVPSVP